MKFHLVIRSPFPCYFLFLRSKYSPQQSLLKISTFIFHIHIKQIHPVRKHLYLFHVELLIFVRVILFTTLGKSYAAWPLQTVATETCLKSIHD